jgi:hypothetical protein
MLTKLLISAMLVLSTPAMAQEPDMQGVVDTAIPLCIENALQYNRGNKTWLRDHMDRAGIRSLHRLFQGCHGRNESHS